MAIVNCPECNGKVSDLASSCPHCGVSLGTCCKCGGVIKMYEEECPHCGTSLSWSSPSNDYYEEKKEEKEGCLKKLGEALIGTFFLLLILFCIEQCGGCSSSDSDSKTSEADKTQQDSRVKAIYKVYFNEKYTEFGKTGKFTLYKDGTGKFDIERVVENWSMFNDCQWSIESVSNPMSRGGDGNPVDVLAIKTAAYGFIIDGSKKLFMTIEDSGLGMEVGHVVEE